VQFAAREGLLPAVALLILPFVLFVLLVNLLPPGKKIRPLQPEQGMRGESGCR